MPLTPLASMTAFARATATTAQGSFAWELKSVNGKGLDLRLRVPPGFEVEEAGWRAMIGNVARRGSVQATLTLQRVAATPEVRVNAVLLQQLAKAVVAALPPGSVIAPPTADGLLAVRGVVEISESREDPAAAAAMGDTAGHLLGEVLTAWQDGRRDEGVALGCLLGGHLDAIAALTDAADSAPGRTAEAVTERLKRSVAALTAASPVLDPERLHQEAVLIAARADVREELDRLRIHRAAAQALLDGGGAAGRRLDFMAQELGREANTLCAKSNDVALTAIGLDLRARIEQFREQVQNLE